MAKKQKRSVEIKTEIDKTNERLAELQPDLSVRAAKLDAAEKGFIDKTIPFDELQAAQTEHDLIARSVNSLRAKLDGLHTEYQDALRAEAREGVFLRMKSAITDSKAHISRYLTIREQLNNLIGELSESLVGFETSQIRFQDQFREVCPGIDNLRLIPKQSRGAFETIKAEMAERGISASDFALVTTRPEAPTVRFGRGLDALERSIEADRIDVLRAERERVRQESLNRKAEIRQKAEEVIMQESEARAANQQKWLSRESNFRHQVSEAKLKVSERAEAA